MGREGVTHVTPSFKSRRCESSVSRTRRSQSRSKCSARGPTKGKKRTRATVKRDTPLIPGQISISYIVRRKNDPTGEA